VDKRTAPKKFADRFIGSVSEEALQTMDERVRSEAQRKSALRKSLMSPAATLRLPPLLEERRQQFGITDGAFAFQPFHDKLLIHQIYAKSATWDTEGRIVKVADTRKRDLKTCPVGVIVAAGAVALDELRINGIDLGHIVLFQRMAPFRHEVEQDESLDAEVIIVRPGDLVGSVDLGDDLRAGKMQIDFNSTDFEHTYRDSAGRVWRPRSANPYMSGEY
jgi:hypothetical protein